MPLLSQEELKTIIAASHSPAVSIFLPTHRAGPEIQQDRIRLKNLLKQAETQLVKEGTRPTDARELIEPVSALIDDASFWRRQSDGLAIVLAHDVFRVYRLPVVVQELVAVSDRFYVKPLLPLLINDARFYILALSQKSVRLLECSRDHIHEIDLPDMPQGMDGALPEGPAPQLQRHTLPIGGRNAARFHGHGVGTDDVDVINLNRYFYKVDDGLENVLKHQQAPLILACVGYLAPLYREVTRYPHVLESIVAGNPDGVKNQELHQKAWAIAEPHFRRDRELAAAQYHERMAEGRASHTIRDILIAAHQGRVATLFVPVSVQRWGRFDFDRLTCEEHAEEQPGDDDLLELTTVQTLMHGGRVYGVQPDEVPDKQLLAAVYRF
jgi:hypothetical protein